MNDFEKVNTIQIPMQEVEKVYEHLRACGHRGVEGVALCAGKQCDDIFQVKEIIIPEQRAFDHEEGLLYMVDGKELHRINVWLYRNNMTLMAQIHSHPKRAYHSETDDTYPIIAAVGGVSIVIPDFGFNPISVNEWAVYRLSPHGMWEEQNPKARKELMYIT